MSSKLLRSVLYLPVVNQRAVQKSLTSLQADALIYDLEDPVSPLVKDEAPTMAYDIFCSNGNPCESILLRWS